MNKNAGFTIVELMITVLVAVILMAMAVPSFQSMIKNNRITADTNRIISDIRLARSEATKRRARVVICRSADPTIANPSCGGTANTWTSGWLIFVDNSAPLNNTYEAATDVLVKVGLASTGANLTIKTNGTSNNNLVFNPNASTNENGGTARFVVCDDRGTEHGKMIEVPPVGRPRLAAAVASCNSPA